MKIYYRKINSSKCLKRLRFKRKCQRIKSQALSHSRLNLNDMCGQGECRREISTGPYKGEAGKVADY